MIEDDELRELFQTESDEHLQSLDDGLLRLEVSPNDASTLEAVFRAAHSLKGAARMLGVSKVELIAHHMEDELGQVRRGQLKLDSSCIDRYSFGLAAMRQFVNEAVNGTRATADIQQVISQLSGGSAPNTHPEHDEVVDFKVSTPEVETTSNLELPASQDETPASTSSFIEVRSGRQKDVSVEVSSLEVSNLEVASPVSPSLFTTLETLHPTGTTLEIEEAPREEFRLQTMRVPPAKLDALMNLSSELTVTGTRVMRGLAAFEEIGVLWEEWQKDMASQRTRWARLEEGQGAGSDFKQLGAFQARSEARLARLGALWEGLQATSYEDVTRLNFVASELEAGIRGVRLLPLSQVFGLFPRLVRDLARELGKEVEFTVYGGEIAADKRILEEIKDPLMHMIRNALDHGIKSPEERERTGKPRTAQLRLHARQGANSVTIELQDDGRGLDLAAIKRAALQKRLHNAAELEAMSTSQLHGLIFSPGFSTSALVTDVSGRGVGMDVVRTNIERLKGSIHVVSEMGVGTTFSVRLPLTLATTRVLLVNVGRRPYAIPVEWVKTILSVPREQIFNLEGRSHFLFDARAIPISPLAALLEMESISGTTTPITLVLDVNGVCFGLQVESLIDEQEVLLKPLGALLKRVRHVSAVTILGAGEICMVLHGPDLAKSALKGALTTSITVEAPAIATRKVILLAEDSITTRTQEKRILESAGYEVVTAVDGLDAWNKLETRSFDGLVSDVEMPNMDGLTLAARIREIPKYNEMPIILVTSLSSDDDKRRGIEVGANAYLTKGTFEQKALLDTLRRLV